ncbi:hypothetical protein ACKUFS_00400 [Pseudomonas cannabina]|uniref:Uncharacterized protein n=2 Tax=Pseudomonas syringae group TaxID=136849 RepID=A0A8T8BX99_PSEYM|nr:MULTISPECIES: hypothetical protein [Pseudomonas syringae group]MBM0140507.1 hypothetical protein [Pseudomonas cannabina pv. alisalensis]QHE95998.1 hypothetical protein PMA4326_004800 [Pseudomonas syringae pv. maculicola str. ES4326]QQN23016.1 hypothetical protein JGS08_04890 [Pseudomonas cannabina pv. alisalensis]UBY96652.1 hypothetical protein LCG56_22225 [Pseudomonas cannabina pv. alisalensis]
MPGQSQGSGIPFWFYPVTWALVVIGWLIVNWQNNRREERKELRAALSQIYEDIGTVQKKALKYHKSISRDQKLETKIIIMQKKLSEHLSFLRLRNSSFVSEYSDFIDAITLENFESVAFVQQTQGSPILDNIIDTAIELESALELEFAMLFRKGFITKTFTLVRQVLEEGAPVGQAMEFIYQYREAIITFFAYLFFVLFIGYVVSLVPTPQ